VKAFDARRVGIALAPAVLVAVPLAVLGVARGAWWLTLAATAALALTVAVVLRRPMRRLRALREPFPARWRELLDEHVSFYRCLDEEHRRRFEDDVRIVLTDLHFEGVRGAPVAEQSKVLAGAGAAMLVHGHPEWELPATRSIVVYPEAFDDEYRIGADGESDIAGMVQHAGAIVFSERDLTGDWANHRRGHNVALHEFAHVLDLEDGYADGVPGALAPRALEPWLERMKIEMDNVRGGRSALRPYAATNEAELFAVAVELFFERPKRMQEQHPELYAALRDYFALDPATLCAEE